MPRCEDVSCLKSNLAPTDIILDAWSQQVVCKECYTKRQTDRNAQTGVRYQLMLSDERGLVGVVGAQGVTVGFNVSAERLKELLNG